jgi:AcrR family transcriptional regulator
MNEPTIESILNFTAQDENDMTEKQQKILHAAIDLFAEKGYAQTSSKEISETACVSEGLLFKHFGSKEKLLYAILLPVLEREIIAIPPGVLDPEHFEQTAENLSGFFESVIDYRFTFVQKNAKRFKILFSELMFRADLQQAFVLSMSKSVFHKPLNDFLSQMKARGKIVNWDNSRLIQTLVINIMGYIEMRFFVSPEQPLDDKAELNHLKTVVCRLLQE